MPCLLGLTTAKKFHGLLSECPHSEGTVSSEKHVVYQISCCFRPKHWERTSFTFVRSSVKENFQTGASQYVNPVSRDHYL